MKERGETLLKLLGFFFSPTVFESDSLVEYEIIGSGVGVDTEITDALELIFVTNSGIFGKEWLDECSGNFQRIGVEQFTEILFGFSRRIFNHEESVVETHGCLLAVICRHPV